MHKYVALARDSFACQRLAELPIGATTGTLDSLSDWEPGEGDTRVVIFSVPQGTRFPGRHLRRVTRTERDSGLPLPDGVRDTDVLVAVKVCSSAKHRDRLAFAIKELHASLTNWRPQKQRRNRRPREDWRRDYAIMG